MELPRATLAQALERGAVAPLDGLARIRVRGADRLRYLNGQVTNDLRKLSPGHSISACVLSAKGKLEALVRVWDAGDALVVEGPAFSADALAARLEKYVVADDVEIGEPERSDEFHAFGEFASLPGALRQADRFGCTGADFPAAAAADLAAAGTGILDETGIETLRILRGIPAWGAELGGDTLPAEAGLDRTAVDFHKGCYIGQETVSRIESVGRVNRSLHRFEADHGAAIAPGDRIFSGDDADSPWGTVTSFADALDLPRAVGLCYLRRGAPDQAAFEARGPGAAAPIHLLDPIT